MQEIASERLIQERKVISAIYLGLAQRSSSCKNPINQCFYAKNKKKDNGTQDLFNWECGIPGPVDVYNLFISRVLGKEGFSS